jgi:rare lipoprotein A (peptidoglycan hydrolase)
MVVSIMLACPAMAAQAAAPAGPDGTAPRKAVTAHRNPGSGRSIAHTNPRTARTNGKLSARRPSPAAPELAAAGPVWNDGATQSGWHQTGIASWYGGKRWQGRSTSGGARYDENDLTAAHATLPIGTKVRVTLEGSQRSVIVTINDRPGTHRRIIDLSRGAAAELGILSRGVAVVTLTAL